MKRDMDLIRELLLKLESWPVERGDMVPISPDAADIGNTAHSWLVVGREGEQDAMTLLAETAAPTEALSNAVAATLQVLTKMRGEVRLVAQGSLPNDGRIIADERPAP